MNVASNETSFTEAATLAAGTRLDADEMTDHVPILINGTQDFVDQGWPGAGTSGDPYLIEGLNITWDIGEIGIHIFNTTAYFIIRDCLVVQGSNTQGILLENTTQGVIEYTTVESQYIGISCYFADNTQILNSDINAISYIGIELAICTDLVLANSHIFSDDSMGILVNECPNFQSTGNTVIVDQTGTYGFYVTQSNNTIIRDGSVTSGSNNLRIDQSYFVDIINMDFHDIDTIGLFCYLSDDYNLTNLYFEGGFLSLVLDTCDDVDVSDVTVEDCSYGIFADQCRNLHISDYDAIDIGIIGLLLENIFEYEIEDVYINSVASDEGISSANLNNGTFSNIELYNIGGASMVCETGENLTITNLVISNGYDYGVYIWDFDNVICQEFHIDQVADTAIYIDITDNLEVTNGTVQYAGSTALYVDSGVNVTISNYALDRNYEGIYATGCTNIEITNNEIKRTEYSGIIVSSCTNASVTGNVIDDSRRDGIEIYYGDNIAIENNIMTDAGLRFSMYTTVTNYIISISGNTINGLPIYYGLNQSSINIDASSYGQIILINSTDMTIDTGTYHSISAPIQVYHCGYVTIQNVTATEAYYGLIAYQTHNLTVTNVDVDGNGYRGFYLRYCDDATVTDVTVHGFRDTSSSYGIHLYYSDLAVIENSLFYHNYRAIYMEYSDNVSIINNEVLDQESYGIWGWHDSDYATIENNVIMNATWGIYGDSGESYVIQENTIRYCDMGIRIGGSSSSNWVVNNNTIESNTDGIYISFGDGHTITNNVVRWSDDDGIYCSGSTGNSIHHNIFAFSDGDNAWDNGALNSSLWDDNVSMGNYWSDYSAPGTYSITGGGQIDYYPMEYAPTEPMIEQLDEFYYAEGSTGNTLTWVPRDNALKNWSVTIDSSPWDSGAWNLVDITVDIDGLAHGTHTLVLTVWDVDQNSASSTVTIHVFDDTKPSLSDEPNRLAFVDATGQEIVWEVSDLHPDHYVIFVDTEEFTTGTWTTGTISVNIDSLDIGEHVLVLYVYDIDGNRAADGVRIRVLDDDIAPTLNSPSDVTYTEGTQENHIIWNADDQYPDRYTIEFNGSTLVSRDWGGSNVILNVDGLSPGTYEYTLTVWDGNGNSASDSVSVIVVSLEDTTPPLIDLGLLLIIGGGIGAVIIVVIVAMQIKKRRAG